MTVFSGWRRYYACGSPTARFGSRFACEEAHGESLRTTEKNRPGHAGTRWESATSQADIRDTRVLHGSGGPCDTDGARRHGQDFQHDGPRAPRVSFFGSANSRDARALDFDVDLMDPEIDLHGPAARGYPERGGCVRRAHRSAHLR